jgi:hypothetical protein
MGLDVRFTWVLPGRIIGMMMWVVGAGWWEVHAGVEVHAYCLLARYSMNAGVPGCVCKAEVRALKGYEV